MIDRPELLLALAFSIDLLVGDPRSWWHPVQSIGSFASSVERVLRSVEWLPLKQAGIAAVVLVVGGSAVVTAGVLDLAFSLHPALGTVLAIVIMYYTLATKDLADHANRVLEALRAGDVQLGRERVAMMVGRDTALLDEAGVAQAATESVAENCVDGVTAPLLYALLFGPVGAVAYKAANTLDSMFGYKNERYLEFGWAAARFDDLLNYLPSRLTVLAIAGAAKVSGMQSSKVFESVTLTAKRHASPNAGFPEAAFAGALGVRFGGPRWYGGERRDLPWLGIAEGECSPEVLGRAVSLMLLSSGLFLLGGIIVKVVL